jgi:hypothetical protein
MEYALPHLVEAVVATTVSFLEDVLGHVDWGCLHSMSGYLMLQTPAM